MRILLVSLLFAGCASGPQIPKEIRVPIATPCIDQAPVKPSMLSDAELLALDDYALVIALARDRRVRQGWEAVLEAAVAGCR